MSSRCGPACGTASNTIVGMVDIYFSNMLNRPFKTDRNSNEMTLSLPFLLEALTH
jgi:hypothetical protein